MLRKQHPFCIGASEDESRLWIVQEKRVCARCTKMSCEIICFGQSALLEKSLKIVLTFSDIRGILSKVAEHGNNENDGTASFRGLL